MNRPLNNLQFRIIQLLVLSALLLTSAFGNTVSLDTSFNGTGYNIQSPVSAPDYGVANSMVVQPDGKIIIGGNTVSDQSPWKFALMRFNTNGTLDTTFGSGGTVLTTVNLGAYGGRLLLQPDGKILLAGYSYTNEYDFAVVRYNTDGSLDTSFNSTGYAVQTVNISSFDECNDIALQQDGKIVLVGRTAQIPGTPDLHWDIGVMRFNANGSLDTTFNGTGILTIDLGAEEAAYSVIMQPDGKILIGGFQRISKANFLLIRLNSDGSFDTTFGAGGSAINSISSVENAIITMGLQSDGKILAGGWGGVITRYATNGVIDMGFAISGVATVPSVDVGRLKVIAGDEFLVALRGGVARYLNDGAQDTNFSIPNINIPNTFCDADTVDIQNDGKILQGGYCNQGVAKFAVMRLQETRTKRFLDFNGDGLTDMSIFRPSNSQWWYSSNLSNQIFAGQWGLSTDRPVPADFTGDGRTDVAIFRPSSGEWFILRSDNGSFYSLAFGTSGDIPLAADYDGDDKADVGVFRPSTNEWYIQKSTGGLVATTFGTSGDKPVPSDYDGDFKTDIAIYRPSTGEWWINRSSDGSIYGFQFGTSSDSPVQGDYTGDNKTDAAVFRQSTGEWFVLPSEGGSYFGVHFGMDGDLPTPGNYGGDSRYDFVVYRPSEDRWYFQLAGGPFFARYFGTAGDQPLPNLFVP